MVFGYKKLRIISIYHNADYVIFLYLCSTNIKTYIIMTNFTTFSTLSLSELMELRSYLRKHIDDCSSRGIDFPRSIFAVLGCINTDIMLINADIDYVKSLESEEY